MEEENKSTGGLEVKIGARFVVDNEMNDKVAASSPIQNFLHQSPSGLWSKWRHRARKLAER